VVDEAAKLYGLGLPGSRGLQWPHAIEEEGTGGGGGRAVAMVRPAEGAGGGGAKPRSEWRMAEALGFTIE